jgi:hypothetical protein
VLGRTQFHCSAPGSKREIRFPALFNVDCELFAILRRLQPGNEIVHR